MNNLCNTTIKTIKNKPSNHQNKNNPQNQQTEIDNSSDSESETNETPENDTNETPTQNEHNIHVDMTSHQPNHQDIHNTTTSKRKSVKITPKIQVRYRFNHDNWNEATVINRASKATGKYPNCWNVKSSNGSEKFINFEKIHQPQIFDKKSTNSDNLEHETNLNKITYNTEKERCQEPELFETTRIELNQLKVREVYDEVGQECISLRWVMKSKVDDNKPGVKA